MITHSLSVSAADSPPAMQRRAEHCDGGIEYLHEGRNDDNHTATSQGLMTACPESLSLAGQWVESREVCRNFAGIRAGRLAANVDLGSTDVPTKSGAWSGS